MASEKTFNHTKELREHLHEIANTLTVVVGIAHLLAKKQESLNPELIENIKAIKEQGTECLNSLEKARLVIEKMEQ